MNNDDERDHEEEAANRRLMQERDDEQPEGFLSMWCGECSMLVGLPHTSHRNTVAAPTPNRDPCGMIYDSSRTDSDGTVHYTRNRAQGSAGGPAQWSSEHDCNPICGCHLASKCLGCMVCMNCDGCYCGDLI